MAEQEPHHDTGWLGLAKEILRTQGLVGLAFAALLVAFLCVGKRVVDTLTQVSPGAVYNLLQTHMADVQDFEIAVDQVRNMVRANCINNARTEEQRERCIYGLTEKEARRAKIPAAPTQTEVK